MQLLNVLGSTAVSLFSSGGNAFAPDVADLIASKYKFVERPARATDYAADSGITFQLGWFAGAVIDKLTLYRDGILVEVRAPTETIDNLLTDLEQNLLEELSVSVSPTGLYSRAYTSRLEVHSVSKILQSVDGLNALALSFTTMLRRYGIDAPECSVTGFTMQADNQLAQSPLKPGRFVIERRAGKPFSSDIYFSEAPLSTPDHLDLLNQLERLG